MANGRPRIALTLGDPAGVGPELVHRLLRRPSAKDGPVEDLDCRPLLVGEAAALAAAAQALDQPVLPLRPVALDDAEAADAAWREGAVPLVESGSEPERAVELGRPGAADARSALRAVDLAVDLVRSGGAEAMVTLPVSKAVIARWVDPSFRGHTDHIARRLGAEVYGRDYLMAFLGDELRVALLSTHVPLREAVVAVTTERVEQALLCLHRASCRRIALAGLNPHAGEGGLLGSEEEEVLRPALQRARAAGVDADGPISPDTVFRRARGAAGRAEFDWVLALYHDQGLIAVKTLAFGTATNWTLGLPILRTSVDHGTAYELAGRGTADVGPLRAVLHCTLGLLARP